MIQNGKENKGFGKKTVTLLLIVLAGGVFWYFFLNETEAAWNEEAVKSVTVLDDGIPLTLSVSGGKTVQEFLREKNVSLRPEDSVFPPLEAKLSTGTTITLERAKEVSVKADGEEKKFFTRALSLGQALTENGVILNEDDIVKPSRETLVTPGVSVSIVRVLIEEVTEEKSVAFKKEAHEDDKLSFRKTTVTQKGEKGIDRLTYRVSSHDGNVVNRKLLKTERVKEPVTEITTQGTYVKLGKSHKGAASWYAWTGTMAAANPWLPKGSYVKVTNVDNGKSVIVVINDRGPFAPGRIIDLDKVAFEKIASLGAGVVNVKMEEITN